MSRWSFSLSFNGRSFYTAGEAYPRYFPDNREMRNPPIFVQHPILIEENNRIQQLQKERQREERQREERERIERERRERERERRERERRERERRERE
ncbi:hypothetical protein M9Y10_019156 [Tritrichomonas musculus]|uniref:Uncharacterized protein n=1 Tax=Tritrichomonas musculus TaxID=1915356 RepID=A0ABR2HJM9_9EUKA